MTTKEEFIEKSQLNYKLREQEILKNELESLKQERVYFSLKKYTRSYLILCKSIKKN
jgi:hypothetical protein